MTSLIRAADGQVLTMRYPGPFFAYPIPMAAEQKLFVQNAEDTLDTYLPVKGSHLKTHGIV
jgi:hypothetical protein